MKTSLTLILWLIATITLANDKAIIDTLNKNNSAIRSFTADVEVVTRRGRIATTAIGKCHFQKPRNFRMNTTLVVKGVPGADIGSNEEFFWFWIRRLDPHTMYLSTHNNIYKTNLPDSINPLWMMDILSFNSVDLHNASITNQSGVIVVQKRVASPRQITVVKMTLIDPKRPAIIGHRIYSTDGKILARSDILSFFQTNAGISVPQVIRTQVYAEQASITMTFKNPQINVNVNTNLFQIPKFSRMVDLSKQRVEFKE